MSNPTGLPDLPASVGGQPIPDFMKFEIVGDGKLPARHELSPEFDFSIKKSPVFGLDSGKKFDEGAVWYPLREVKFALSDTGLGHYQAHYPGRSTTAVGGLSSTNSIGLKLKKEEHIVGFRACSSHNLIEGVRVWMNDGSHKDFGKVQGETERGKDPEAFFVPPDHEVINFFGHTNDDGQIHGLGVSYIRRLASLSARAPKCGSTAGHDLISWTLIRNAHQAASKASDPTLTALLSQTYLDASTQQSWANGDMATIASKRDRASKDLAPLYDRIDKEGDAAWTLVRDPNTQQEYYTCHNNNAIVWSYVNDQPNTSGDDNVKKSIISIGSYSKSENMLGISGYIWDNLPATAIAAVIGLAVTFLVQPLIVQGITWGIAFAATQLAQYLAFAGAPALAALIPGSVIAVGGLIIAGVIGTFVAFGVMALIGLIWKKFWIVFNVYNFDAEEEWHNISHYGDNSIIPNGEWELKWIATFKPADSVVFPPGFKPLEPLENVVTYLSMTFKNDSEFMQGLGEAILMRRGQDLKVGLAMKYNVYYLYDNEIHLEYIPEDPNSFALQRYYETNNWVKAYSLQVNADKYPIVGYTPKLSGSDGGDYYYDISIGLPPPVVR